MIDKQRIAAKEFAEKWQGKGYERGQSQTFWLELLQKVFFVEDPFSFIKFEEKVKITNTGFINGRIPKTKVLIEQKSLEIDLKKEKQEFILIKVKGHSAENAAARKEKSLFVSIISSVLIT